MKALFAASSTVVTCIALLALSSSCSIIVGTHAWFERKEPVLSKAARGELRCPGEPVSFVSTAHDDWREVEARGCGRAVQYRYLRVGPVENWVKWE